MVKRTVLYSFFLWLSLFLISAGGFYYAYGEFKKISEQKWELLKVMNQIESTRKTWIWIWDFKNTGKSLVNWDKNLENIMNLIEKDFFIEHFENKSESLYEDFISKKIQEIEELESSDSQKQMEKISSTVLPSFVETWLDIDGDEDFSELKFVNYVERIMQTFNLEYSWEIGISDILPLEVEDKKKNKASDRELLANKIFYIPVSFGITWSKASVIDFLYFIENVWKVEALDNLLYVKNDTYFKKWDEFFRSSDLVLEWEVNRWDYNIYMNQIADIETITFEEYIYEKRDGDRRGEFISNLRKSPQWLEKFSVDVTLRFYIKGISDYKVEKKYKQVISNLLEYSVDIKNSQNALASLKSNLKTPEVALLIKRLVSYDAIIVELKKNMAVYRELSQEDIYGDILKALEMEKKLVSDLKKTAGITKIKIEKFEQEEENIIN